VSGSEDWRLSYCMREGGCPTSADAWHRAEEYPGSRRHDEKGERRKAQREEAMSRWRVRTPGLRGDVSIL
jgi:hypothetical protein